MRKNFILTLFIVISITFVSSYVSATNDFDFISNDTSNNIEYTNSSSTSNTPADDNTMPNGISSSGTTLPETGTEDDDSYTYSSSNPSDRETNTIKRTLAGQEVSKSEFENSTYEYEYETTEDGKQYSVGTLRDFLIVSPNGSIIVNPRRRRGWF